MSTVMAVQYDSFIKLSHYIYIFFSFRHTDHRKAEILDTAVVFKTNAVIKMFLYESGV